MKSTILLSKELVVRHSLRPDINREYLEVACPNGWDDVKKLTAKVVLFDGRRFVWTGWNSDRNVSYLVRPINGNNLKIATIL
jgi:hypothetical protein